MPAITRTRPTLWARLKEGDKALATGDSMQTGNQIIGGIPPKYAAFPELFVQSHTDAIELLPALPTAWTNGHVSGLRARGGYEVSLQWENRQLTGCQIYSPFGTTPLGLWSSAQRAGPEPSTWLLHRPGRYQGALLNLATDARVTLALPSK
jgi:hypothetical protein